MTRRGDLIFSAACLVVAVAVLLYFARPDREPPAVAGTTPALNEPPAQPPPSPTTIVVRGGRPGKMVDGEWKPMRRVTKEAKDDGEVGEAGIDGVDLLSPFLAPEVLAGLDDSTLPTEEGLWLRTVDWWLSQELDRDGDGPGLPVSLFEITGDELAELMPDEEHYALGGDVTLFDLVGVPTREDVARGFADPQVRAAFEEWCKLDIPVLGLDVHALESGDPSKLEEFRERIRASANAARDQLMVELERATGYPHWSFLGRVMSAWMTEPQSLLETPR